jgi:hypothetical protein
MVTKLGFPELYIVWLWEMIKHMKLVIVSQAFLLFRRFIFLCKSTVQLEKRSSNLVSIWYTIADFLAL